MPILTLALFAAFGACVLAQFYMMRQVRRVLADKHPETWRDLSSRTFFIDNAVFSFVWKKRYMALADPELDQLGRRMRRLQVLALAIWLAYGASILTTFGSPASGGR